MLVHLTEFVPGLSAYRRSRCTTYWSSTAGVDASSSRAASHQRFRINVLERRLEHSATPPLSFGRGMNAAVRLCLFSCVSHASRGTIFTYCHPAGICFCLGFVPAKRKQPQIPFGNDEEGLVAFDTLPHSAMPKDQLIPPRAPRSHCYDLAPALAVKALGDQAVASPLQPGSRSRSGRGRGRASRRSCHSPPSPSITCSDTPAALLAAATRHPSESDASIHAHESTTHAAGRRRSSRCQCRSCPDRPTSARPSSRAEVEIRTCRRSAADPCAHIAAGVIDERHILKLRLDRRQDRRCGDTSVARTRQRRPEVLQVPRPWVGRVRVKLRFQLRRPARCSSPIAIVAPAARRARIAVQVLRKQVDGAAHDLGTALRSRPGSRLTQSRRDERIRIGREDDARTRTAMPCQAPRAARKPHPSACGRAVPDVRVARVQACTSAIMQDEKIW